MNPLSKQTQDLVARLETATVLQTLARDPAEVASVVRQVGDSGEVAAVPSVLPFVLHSDGRLAGAAAAAVRSLLQVASSAELAQLDLVCRRFSYYGWPPGW